MNQTQLDKAQAYNDKGVDLYNRGDYQAARLHYEKSLAIRRHMLGQEHQVTAQTLNNLCIVLCKLGADHPTTRDYQRWLEDIEQKRRQRRESPWLQP